METQTNHFSEDELPVLAAISPMPIIKKYGAYMILSSIAYTLLPLFFPSIIGNKLIGFIGFAISIALFYLAYKDHKTNDLRGFLPFGRIVRIAFLCGVIATPILAAWVFIFYSYIAPNQLDLMAEMVRGEIEKGMPDNPEAVDAMMELYNKWLFNPIAQAVSMLLASIPTYLVTGILTGLFQRKELR